MFQHHLHTSFFNNMGKCIRLAITGGIGSGKSVVSRMLDIMGVPVYDCDTRAKEMMVHDTLVVAELKRMFGEECYNEDGSLNRNYIASCIFTDKENIKRVNGLVHPLIKADFNRWACEQNVPLVAVETAILYESGMIDAVDKVLVVWAGRETAIERTMARSGMSRVQVESRMDNQMSADDLLLLSDYSICNDKGIPVMGQLVSLLEELKNISNFAVTD